MAPSSSVTSSCPTGTRSSSTRPSNWQDLLATRFSEADKASLPLEAQAEGRQFLQAYDRALFERSLPTLDTWYRSPEGQGELLYRFQRWWPMLMSWAANAMPSHDARHALCRVPAAALECIAADQVQGAARLGVLGALFHDTGRWVEERLFGHPTEGVFHARISYLLTREWLADTEIPPVLQAEVLHAVLTHTTGADPRSPVIARVTVAADRDQLHGPEFAMRLVHGLAAPPFETFHPRPQGPLGNSVLASLLHIAAHPLEAPMPWLQERHNQLHPDSLAFVMLATDLREYGAGLQPVMNKCLPTWVAEAQARAAQALAPTEGSAADWALRLVDTPQASPCAAALEQLTARMNAVPSALQDSATRALAYAVRRRDQEATRLTASLTRLESLFHAQGDKFCAHVAREVRVALAPQAG